jgi:hypothetical protein
VPQSAARGAKKVSPHAADGTAVVFYDEQPGIHATVSTASDLPLRPGKHTAAAALAGRRGGCFVDGDP